MAITYRTTGDWGSGKGSNLTASEVDTNFYDLNQRVTTIETNPVEPNNIYNIVYSSNELQIILNDGSIYGPFAISGASFKGAGEWASNTNYVIGDIITVSSGQNLTSANFGSYIVVQNHLSDANFNPSKTINSNPVYVQISIKPYLKTTITPTYNAQIPAFTFINYNNDIYLTLETINPNNSGALDTLINTGIVVNVSNTNTLKFKNLADVTEFIAGDAEKWVKISADGTEVFYDDLRLTSLADGPGSLSGKSKQVVRVNAAETSLEFKAFNFIDLADAPQTYSGSANYHIKVNASGTGLEFSPSPGTNFTGLSDVPQSYTNQALKYVRVNSGETGLEFATVSVGSFINLTDVPQSYANSGGKLLAVNSSASGLEFVPASGASGVSALNYASTQSPSGVTNVEFLNIPSYVKRINIHYSAMKLSGTADYVFQFGDANGYITSSYTSVYSYLRTSANGSSGTITSGFSCYGGGSTNTSHGQCSFILLDAATALWCFSLTGSNITGANYFTVHAGGSKSFGANFVPTKLKILSSNGTDTFQTGTKINISYE